MSDIVIRPVRPNTVVIGGGGNSSGSDVVDQSLSTTSTNAVSNKAVTTAINQKQDKQDNSLNTTAKTIVGAINELKTAVENGGGGGDIDLSSIEQDIADLQEGKADKIGVVEVVGADGNYKFDIYPNVLNVLLAVDNTAGMCEMYIRKVGEESGKVNNYFFKVTFPESAGGSLDFGWDITWYGGEVPTWQAGKTYEVSIIDGLALWAEF